MEKWISGSGWVECNDSSVKSGAKVISDTSNRYEVFIQEERGVTQFYRGFCESCRVNLYDIIMDDSIMYSIKEAMNTSTIERTREFVSDNIDMFNFSWSGDKIVITFMNDLIIEYDRVDD